MTFTRHLPPSTFPGVFHEFPTMEIRGQPLLNEEKDAIAQNLFGNIGYSDTATLLYRNRPGPTNKEIRAFLTKTRHYSKRKRTWTLALKSYSNLEQLRTFWTQLINEVIASLGVEREGSTRKAVNSCGTGLSHSNKPDLKSSPDIVIQSTGPSFETPEDGDLGYSNIASCIEVKLEQDCWPVSDQIYQLGLYYQQLLAHQSNRRSGRGLFLTETHVTLVHFDCAGAHYTIPINVHESPEALVRLILGVSSFEEHILGFDTTIRWTHKDGKKTDATMDVRQIRGNSCTYTTYRSLKLHSREQQTTIVGRGTTCWTAENPKTGEKVFIKDQFRKWNATAEGDMLMKARGIEGMVQLIDYEPDRTTVSEMRAVGGRPELSERREKIQSRLVMKMCGTGRPIRDFKSEMQLIAALRDAIAAHGNLFYLKGILHRDVSYNNVLLGDEDAPAGSRGYLIDCDMSIEVENLSYALSLCVGTVVTQAISVLRSWNECHRQDVITYRDHFDDLQSFFFILLLIVITMDGPGKDRFSAEVVRWKESINTEDRDSAADFKYGMIFEPEELELVIEGANPTSKDDTDVILVSNYWSQSTIDLLKAFRNLLKDDVDWKEGLIWDGSPDFLEQTIRQEESVKEAEGLYQKVLAEFDKALDAMKPQEDEFIERKRKARDDEEQGIEKEEECQEKEDAVRGEGGKADVPVARQIKRMKVAKALPQQER